MKSAGKVLLHPVVVAGVVFAVLPLVLPLIGSSASLATEIAIYALYGLGFNLLLGYTGLVSFGASAFFGAASYAAGLAMLYLFNNMYLSIVFGTVTAAVLGLLIGLLILRRRGIYMPSSGWTRFFVQLLGACLVMGGVMHWFAISFDWIGMHAEPVRRIALLGACLVLFAALYFGMLWLMGFKYAYFRRRVK